MFKLWCRIVVLHVAVVGGIAHGQSGDRLARSQIFHEQHVEDSSLLTHRSVESLPANEQVDVLSTWLLPGADHDVLRCPVAFGQTHPVGEDLWFDRNGPNRVPTGGELISPVYDLLDAARETGRLDEVKRRLSGLRPAPEVAAWQTLIAIAEDDSEAALLSLDAMRQLEPKRPQEAGPTNHVLLVLTRGAIYPPLYDPVSELLATFTYWGNVEFAKSVPRRHVSALAGAVRIRIDEQASPTGGQWRSTDSMRQWAPVSRTTAFSRGVGQPPASWVWKHGHVENIGSHDDDYLYYMSPLYGDYEVECDVTGFNGLDSHLMVAGKWLGPLYTHTDYETGYFHGGRQRTTFAPPLTRTQQWIHYRCVVRDGMRSTFVNGRKLHSESVEAGHDPWLAIRSTARHEGAVRNLRITGEPDIPEDIQLDAESHLGAWLPYYEGLEIGAGRSLWYRKTATDQPNQTIGLRLPESKAHCLTDGMRESLLRYHRPMLEDATIEYEFYYQAGQKDANPAVDRAVFLLSPVGVRLHWLTDGRYEQSDRSGDFVVSEPECQRGDGVPLRDGDWNQARVSLHGDTVSIEVNGQLVYMRDIEVTNQRTFGFFHYADQTELQVRNVVWRGNWPTSLPELKEQELFEPQAEFLDGDAEQIAQSLVHDFSSDGLDESRFTVIRGTPGEHLQAKESGLYAARQSADVYAEATIACSVELQGDFDVLAEYSDFEAAASPSGHGTIAITVLFDTSTGEEASLLYRRLNHTGAGLYNRFDCAAVKYVDGGNRQDDIAREPFDQTSGTLRLSRRGDMLYYLTAENDSRQFVIRGSTRVPVAPVKLDGLRMMCQVHQPGGSASVVWKRLTVRAERLSGRAMGAEQSHVAELDRERDALPERVTYDLSSSAPGELDFRFWNHDRMWNEQDGGLLLESTGSKEWASAGMSLGKTLSGDFDIAIEVEPREFYIPEGENRVSLYLQVGLPDEDATRFSVIFTRNSRGISEVIVEVRERTAGGGWLFRPLSIIEMETVSSLRIARRGTRLIALVRGDDESAERVVGMLDRPAVPVPLHATNVMVHSGDVGRSASAVVSKLTVTAKSIGPKVVVRPQRPVVESILDLFR